MRSSFVLRTEALANNLDLCTVGGTLEGVGGTSAPCFPELLVKESIQRCYP